MKIEALFLGVVTFIAIVITGVIMINDMNKNYGDLGVNISNSSFKNTWQDSAEIYNISISAKDDVIGTELSDTNIVSSSYKGAFSAFRLAKNTFSFINSLIIDMANTLHIPAFWVQLALTAIAIMITFAIIYMVLKFATG